MVRACCRNGVVLAALLFSGCGSDDQPLDDGGTFEGASCAPGKCSGCCWGATCEPGQSNEACGSAGLPCVKCVDNEVCTQSQCIEYSSTCNPATCATGCCDKDTCRPGTSKEACGSGGFPCIACAASQECEAQSCGCGPGTCVGCCDAEGTCRSGRTEAACGAGGEGCIACAADQLCVDGACTSSGDCSPATCAGCCTGSECHKGDEDGACGLGGLSCKACTSPESCQSGTCVDASQCSPSSCSGCCEGSQCLSGSGGASCGSGGKPCQICSSNQLCQSGACALDPSSQWSIVIGEAEIDTAKSWDTLVYTEPDPFVELSVGSSSGKTTTKSDTYFPKWDELLFAATAKEITASGMKMEVRDADLYGSELIGACVATVDETVLQAGAGYISSCGTEGHVKKLTFSFTPK